MILILNLKRLNISQTAAIQGQHPKLTPRRTVAVSLRPFVLLLSVFLIAGQAWTECRSAAVPSDRNTAAWIQQQIDQAIATGAKSVTIPPGNYHVAAQQWGYNVLGVYNANGFAVTVR